MSKRAGRFALVCCLSWILTSLSGGALSGQTLHVRPYAPDTLWTQTFGAPGFDDEGNCVRETSDGGFIIAGPSFDHSSYITRAQLIRTDSLGNILWTGTYGTTGWSVANAVREASDGGIIVAGSTSRELGGTDVYLIRTDADGNELWTRTYGPREFQTGEDVCLTSDGGYLIAGSITIGDGTSNAFFVRTDAAGDTLWTRNTGYGPDDPNDQEVRSVFETSDGGFIATGMTGPTLETSEDVYLVKLDSLGHPSWTRKYGFWWNDWGESVIETSGGDYLIAGTRESAAGVEYADVWLIETDAGGNVRWSRTYGGTGSQGGHSVDETRTGHYVVAGGSSGAAYLLETAGNGDPTWSTTPGGTVANSIRTVSGGGCVAAGYTLAWGFRAVYLVRIASDLPVHERSRANRAP